MNKIIKSVHSVTGTVIAVFFFMWFCTGLVLIYHPYPRLDDNQANHYRETVVGDSLKPITHYTDSLWADTIQSLKVRQHLGQTLVKVGTADSSYTMCADTTEKKKRISFEDVQTIAARWMDDTPVRVDTLRERAQWVLYERYEKALPIYKFVYDDDEAHELFISGKTGEVQQLTTREQRFWSWIGAIPHKFYYPCIRRDVDIWKTVITTGGILCLLAALSGLWHGIEVQAQVWKRKRKLTNPYKKATYKWHHVLGLIFGVFIIGWGISGSLAMQKVPKWLVPYEHEYFMHSPDIWEGDSLPLSRFRLDYRKVLAEYPDVKEIEWHMVGERPVYTVISDSNEIFIDASDSVPQPLKVSPEAVKTAMKRLYGEDANVTIELMDEYDEYHMASYDYSPPLPVYKASINNEDGDVYYIGTDTDYSRFFNNNKRARKWLFGAMHYLNIRCIVSNPTLWHICIWILCLAGMAVTFTGILLGVKYIRRKL